eukprot:jgi/Undpi1/12424/HiC_scaffold_5.g02096.m1
MVEIRSEIERLWAVKSLGQNRSAWGILQQKALWVASRNGDGRAEKPRYDVPQGVGVKSRRRLSSSSTSSVCLVFGDCCNRYYEESGKARVVATIHILYHRLAVRPEVCQWVAGRGSSSASTGSWLRESTRSPRSRSAKHTLALGGIASMPKLRAGSEAAARLLESDAAEDWAAAFACYEDSVRRLSEEKGRLGLVELDAWWRTELPAALRSRAPEAFLTKEELVKVVRWKLWMGVVRPNLLRFATETDPKQVKAKSREAFRFLPRSSTSPSKGGDGDVARMSRGPLKNAVNALTSDLKGVGPATASAVLAAACSGCPFDADEVIDAVMMTGTRKYNLAEYLQVQEKLEEKAVSLGSPWDAERVRKALWSQAMHSRFGLVVMPSPGAGTPSSRGERASANRDDDEGGGSKKGKSRKSRDADAVSGAKNDEKRHKSRR